MVLFYSLLLTRPPLSLSAYLFLKILITQFLYAYFLFYPQIIFQSLSKDFLLIHSPISQFSSAFLLCTPLFLSFYPCMCLPLSAYLLASMKVLPSSLLKILFLMLHFTLNIEFSVWNYFPPTFYLL